jgi:hypothetical protein
VFSPLEYAQSHESQTLVHFLEESIEVDHTHDSLSGNIKHHDA